MRLGNGREERLSHTNMRPTILLVFLSVYRMDCEAGLKSWYNNWLETVKVCSSVCPLFHNHVCGLDPRLGYILADNNCLLMQHNLCRKTDYKIVQDSTCEGLLNATSDYLPKILTLTNSIV
ncbi:hypothetical protein J6590_025849 [Homalodisca vitripennis]|nr:hypothetical protein J6590_025849 [Homalodisca vitripennis]